MGLGLLVYGNYPVLGGLGNQMVLFTVSIIHVADSLLVLGSSRNTSSTEDCKRTVYKKDSCITHHSYNPKRYCTGHRGPWIPLTCVYLYFFPSDMPPETPQIIMVEIYPNVIFGIHVPGILNTKP